MLRYSEVGGEWCIVHTNQSHAEQNTITAGAEDFLLQKQK